MSESARRSVTLRPDDPPRAPRSASAAGQPVQGDWEGPTYYGRSQLKPAPFENSIVGSYIFIGGLSGATMLISTVADLTSGQEAASLVGRGRYMALLAPTLGSMLLIYDLRTPQRFYNMLRVAKPTSPMSIGTWTLMTFSAAAGVTAAAQMLSDASPGRNWTRALARLTQIPAAIAGAGMMTYTAALLSATSTPLWAAAPRALAVRFASSSLAAGAAALSIGEKSEPTSKALRGLAVAALAVDLAAAEAARKSYRERGVDPALRGAAGRTERVGATGLGVALPLSLLAASFVFGRRPSPGVSGLAAVAILAGSAALRISILAAGDESAERPDVSFRFASGKRAAEVS
jgi:formate-dependent nitrite reductase membrane component NrfD